MLIGMLCTDLDLLTLTATQLPPDDGSGDADDNYQDMIYCLAHTNLRRWKNSAHRR